MDWKLNSAVLFLAALSLASLSGASQGLFWKQLAWLALGATIVAIVVNFDWRSFVNHRAVIMGIYSLAIFFLLLTLFVGSRVGGQKNWISIGSFKFEPSAFAALALIIVLASFFKKEHRSIARVSKILKSFVYFAIPASFCALQPDMGSIIILFSIWFGFILVSGIPWKHLMVTILIFSVVAVGMWFVVFKDYQKERVIGLFFPNRDVLGANYNVIQAKIAIGSAGFFGKGFRQGTQTQLGFLPEAQTDFIFSAIIEEWGLFSGLLIVAAFGFIIFRIALIGLDDSNNFNNFICLGTAIYFCANFLFNTGSNTGLLPVVGVPFPFLSYGGTHLMMESILLGMVQSVKARR